MRGDASTARSGAAPPRGIPGHLRQRGLSTQTGVEVVQRADLAYGETAFGLAIEIGDWDRLTGASIGAYLGLVPTESSSGQSRSQGSITKTGNTHARRLLVEAGWQHLKPYRTPGATMRARSELAPAAARARGHAGNQRLHQRWVHFADRKKP